MTRLIVMDTETGGTDPEKHPLIQWAGVAVDERWNETEAFEVKLRFDVGLCEEEALKINSYNPDLWETEAVDRHVAVKAIGDFMRRHATVEMVSQRTGRPYRVARLCGHNAAAFDFPFTLKLFKSCGAFLPAAFLVLDTLQLAQWVFLDDSEPPVNLKLGTLAACLGVPVDPEEAHDALADSRTAAAVAGLLLARLGRGVEAQPIPEEVPA